MYSLKQIPSGINGKWHISVQPQDEKAAALQINNTAKLSVLTHLSFIHFMLYSIQFDKP